MSVIYKLVLFIFLLKGIFSEKDIKDLFNHFISEFKGEYKGYRQTLNYPLFKIYIDRNRFLPLILGTVTVDNSTLVATDVIITLLGDFLFQFPLMNNVFSYYDVLIEYKISKLEILFESEKKIRIVNMNCTSHPFISKFYDIMTSPHFEDFQKDTNNELLKSLRLLTYDRLEHIIDYYVMYLSDFYGVMELFDDYSSKAEEERLKYVSYSYTNDTIYPFQEDIIIENVHVYYDLTLESSEKVRLDTKYLVIKLGYGKYSKSDLVINNVGLIPVKERTWARGVISSFFNKYFSKAIDKYYPNMKWEKEFFTK